MNGIPIAYLDINSWIGISPGAIHCYGKLLFNDKSVKGDYSDQRKEVEITKRLTQKEAIKINKQERYLGDLAGIYKKGNKYSGFDTKEEIIKKVIRVWKKLFPKAKVLICGSNSTCSPQQPIDARDIKLLKKLKKIYKEFIDNGEFCQKLPRNFNEEDKLQKKRADKICDKWYKVLGQEWK